MFKMKILLAPLSTILLPLFLSLRGRYLPDRGSVFPEILVLIYHIPWSYTPIDANLGPQCHGNIASSYVISLFLDIFLILLRPLTSLFLPVVGLHVPSFRLVSSCFFDMSYFLHKFLLPLLFLLFVFHCLSFFPHSA